MSRSGRISQGKMCSFLEFMLISNLGSENSLELKISLRERRIYRSIKKGKHGKGKMPHFSMSFVMASANINHGLAWEWKKKKGMAARVFPKNNLQES